MCKRWSLRDLPEITPFIAIVTGYSCPGYTAIWTKSRKNSMLISPLIIFYLDISFTYVLMCIFLFSFFSEVGSLCLIHAPCPYLTYINWLLRSYQKSQIQEKINIYKCSTYFIKITRTSAYTCHIHCINLYLTYNKY